MHISATIIQESTDNAVVQTEWKVSTIKVLAESDVAA